MKIAVFDFDHTLIHEESLWSFVQMACGRLHSLMNLVMALFLVWRRVRLPSQHWKTQVKIVLLEKSLSGKSLHGLQSKIPQLQNRLTLKSHVVHILRQHHQQGHHIVILSGALDVYLPGLLSGLGLPYDAVFCTCMEIKNKHLTGKILGTNCVREAKREILKKYLESHGSITESWGYGNWPDDQPMLGLVDHPSYV